MRYLSRTRKYNLFAEKAGLQKITEQKPVVSLLAIAAFLSKSCFDPIAPAVLFLSLNSSFILEKCTRKILSTGENYLAKTRQKTSPRRGLLHQNLNFA
ncbi:MAG TPA: hypothetical protein VF893_08520 [Candidatus Bathyarchaeia archaeon]